MNHYSELWVEKYRPKKVEELVLSEESLATIKDLEGDIPHILFYGRAGTGKTSTAKILVNHVLDCQYLYINASDENGIDTIRNKVINFAQTRSVDGKKKTIILDEADFLTGASLRILRGVMEEYSETCRFILTCNYFDKIIEPIRSRCILVNIKPDLKGCVKRCYDILKNENVKVSPETMKELGNFVKGRFPDLRRMVNDLQKFSTSGNLEFSPKDFLSEFTKNLMDKLLVEDLDVLELRKFVIESEADFDSDYQMIYKEIFDYLYGCNMADQKKKESMLLVGEFAYRDISVVDHELNFFCFLLEFEKCA